jgi:hypothetical protein
VQVDNLPEDGVDPPPETLQLDGTATVRFTEALNSATGASFPPTDHEAGPNSPAGQ